MREFDAAVVRRNDEADRDTTLAWTVASLVWREKLPDLRSLLINKGPAALGQQTLDEQRKALKQVSEYYRIPLREVTH